MNRFLLLISLSILLAFNSATSFLYANNPVYENRRLAYIDSSLAHFSDHAIVLQAYKNQPLNQSALDGMTVGITTHGTVDFDLVKLVRILFLTNAQSNTTYNSQILTAVNSLPYWINYGDTLRGYWSENHMIQWMSSDWLLHEKYGKAIDPHLSSRLRHYLRVKIKYGFYEFFSSVYAPYCLSGLLNLADFSQDVEIKNLASQAATRLLKSILMVTNDKGVFFPAAGRNYTGKYDSPYDQNHNNLIYMLTGFGSAPTSASHGGVFLATSSLFTDSISTSWSATLDTLYKNGHSLDSSFVINDSLYPLDRTIAQWSFGGYFHPRVAQETGQLLVDSNMWKHVDFQPFYSLRNISPPAFPNIAEYLGVASKSSLLCGEDIAIFKHNSITLSSIQDYWKGKLGYQQFPCVANVGTTAVYVASGQVDSTWNAGGGSNNNEHLPYVKQKKNIALLMYRPEPKPDILPYTHNEVALRWATNDFDQVVYDSLWIIGRQQNRFAAVRRYCTDYISGVPACNYNTDGQAWVVVVGDSTMYGSFSNFQTIVHQSQFEEQRYYDSVNKKSTYYAKIVFDTTTIDYAWENDSVNTTGIDKIEENQIAVYPNPVKDEAVIDISQLNGKPFSLEILNVAGQKVYDRKIAEKSSNDLHINTSDLHAGVYILSINCEEKSYKSRMVKIE